MSVESGSTARINNFDLLRLVAASQVMIEHSFLYLGLAHPAGLKFLSYIQGVPIFFVISGFLISASWKRSPNAFEYTVRRSARIFPGLWCCLFLTVLAILAFGIKVPVFGGVVWVAMQMVGAIHTPAFLSGFGVGAYNTSLWTIPVELQFYVVVIGVYAIARLYDPRKTATAIFVAFTIIAAVLYLTWLPPLGHPETGLQKLVRYSFVPHFYMFMAGVVIREWGLHNTSLLRGRGLYWIAGYAVYCLLVPQDALNHPLANMVGRLILAVTVISTAYSLPTLSSRTLRGTDISYGVYIYHGLMINIALMLGLRGSLGGVAFVVLTVPFLAAISWFAVEKPVLEYAHRKTKKRVVEETAGASASAA